MPHKPEIEQVSVLISAEAFEAIDGTVQQRTGMNWLKYSEAYPLSSLNIVHEVIERQGDVIDTSSRPIQVFISIGHSICTHPYARFRRTHKESESVPLFDFMVFEDD